MQNKKRYERLDKYRSKKYRLEMVIPNDLAERFRSLPGLIDHAHGERLESLCTLWEEHYAKEADIPAKDSEMPPSWDVLLKMSDDLDKALNQPVDENGNPLPPVPSYAELQRGVDAFQIRRSEVNRRSREVQYWRRFRRKNKGFGKALRVLGQRIHRGLPDLILDNLLPFTSHKEVLGLLDLPESHQEIIFGRLLQGETDLKQAAAGFVETLREAIIVHEAKRDHHYYRSELDELHEL